MTVWRRRLLVLALVAAGPVQAQPRSPVQTLAVDLRESIESMSVSARNAAGEQRTLVIPLTVYRPPGDGPHPLVVMNHGRDPPEQRRTMGRARYELLARYLVTKGFVVAVPTRVGYGPSFGPFDPEDGGTCNDLRLGGMADAAADQALAAVEHLRQRPWVDTSRWLVIGQSVGGMAALATAARNPPGLVGAINFAGGAGGNPARRPGAPCSPDGLAQLWSARAAGAAVPTLWLYWANDLYWGAQLPLRWAVAWADAGGRVELHQLSSVGSDGHAGITSDMDQWVPLVESWLSARALGAPHPRWPSLPSGHAQVDETDKVPLPAAAIDNGYRRFLAAALPRALAVGSTGTYGWARGDWAPGRALAQCQRHSSSPCALYAVDNAVVWTAASASTR